MQKCSLADFFLVVFCLLWFPKGQWDVFLPPFPEFGCHQHLPLISFSKTPFWVIRTCKLALPLGLVGIVPALCRHGRAGVSLGRGSGPAAQQPLFPRPGMCLGRCPLLTRAERPRCFTLSTQVGHKNNISQRD